MELVRAFVGCLLDLGTTRKLADLVRGLRRGAEGAGWRASWVPPPNLHVTVRFLGDVDLGLVAPLGDALAGVARRTEPLRLGISAVGAFPDRTRPRVLVAEVTRGHEALVALASAVDEALWEVGIPREKRPFRGHVTLARVRTVGSALPALEAPPTELGSALVADLTLYRSDLLRQGAEYHVLARHLLGGSRSGGSPGEGQ